MDIAGQPALVTGGGSGLGAETARELARRGARVAVLDIDGAAARAVAAEAGGIGLACDVADAAGMEAALAAAEAAHGPARLLFNVAGIAPARRLVGRDGSAAPLEEFRRVVEVNLVGTYNACRLYAARAARLDPLGDDGERGVIVCTASVAAFEGQVGQEAYAASKGGVASMTLPMARDLAQHGIRVVTIAPGLFETPLIQAMPEAVQRSLAGTMPFPRRLGRPAEFARLAAEIVGNAALNGAVIRLDCALRMAAR